MEFLSTFFFVFILSIIYSSFGEWLLHKYVMHRVFGRFTYPFDAHTRVHHHQFNAEVRYHFIDQNSQEVRKIPMAWWNGPVLTLLFSIPFGILAFIYGIWSIWIGAVCGIGAYYIMYEYIHWCFHLPKARRVEKSWLFRRLNGHHLLHHRYMGKNFNVVFPLADLIFGTLILRSKIAFKQPNHPAVPDVQPRSQSS